MRRTGMLPTMCTLTIALAGSAAAQSVPSAGTTTVSPDAQPMSLGDLARQIKVQKQSESQPTTVIDDENLPRNGQGISIVGSGVTAEGSTSRGPASPAARFSSSGRLTLLDFWASWCGPCRESVPDLKALQQTYGSDQLQVISVDEDKNEDAGRSYATAHGMNWAVQFDPSGATARQHNVSAYPTFILVDASGREVRRFVGVDPSQPLANRLATYLDHSRKTTL